MTDPRILRTVDGALCTLTLNRPDKLNALDTETFDALDSELARLEEQSATIGCVLLRGEGRAFCAGADLGTMGRRADGSEVDPAFKPGVVDRLARLPQPVIAAIHGSCFTGGLELALACDFLIADDTAVFADTHGKWGLVAAWGMMQRLPRRIGLPAARELMMTGRQLCAAEARSLGLIDRLSGEGGLDRASRDLADELLAASWHTVFAIKRTLRKTEGLGLADALSLERLAYPGSAPDAAERMAKFTKRREQAK